MNECAACRSTNAEGLALCAKCGAPLAGSRGGTRADDFHEAAAKKGLDDLDRVRRLRRIHAFVGAMTFFLLQLLLGLPESLMPLALSLNAIFSAVMGLPIGYLISRFRAGAVGGALISMIAFMIMGLVLGWLSGEGPRQALFFGLLGLIPGALIGIHVTMDE